MDSTGDHLDEAAAKAVDLAAMLTTPTDLDDTLRIGVGQHLAYMAGLLRGGGGRRIEELSMAVPMSTEEANAPKVRLPLTVSDEFLRAMKLREQRDELLAAAWAAVGDIELLRDEDRRLHEVVTRIEQES